MNTTLREVSQLGTALEIESPKRWGYRRIATAATRRLAKRRTDLQIEQAAERLLFWQLIKREVERSRRHDSSFTVMCLQRTDVDLRTVTNQIQPSLRSTDAAVAEWDRTLVLLPETTVDEAAHVVKRLGTVSAVPFSDGDWQRIEFPRDALTLGALVDALLQPGLGERVLLAG